jgi:hypothetical protein
MSKEENLFCKYSWSGYLPRLILLSEETGIQKTLRPSKQDSLIEARHQRFDHWRFYPLTRSSGDGAPNYERQLWNPQKCGNCRFRDKRGKIHLVCTRFMERVLFAHWCSDWQPISQDGVKILPTDLTLINTHLANRRLTSDENRD